MSQNTQIYSRKRVRLEDGKRLELPGLKIANTKYIGKGVTSLVYQGDLLDDATGKVIRRVVMKELYPDPQKEGEEIYVGRRADGTLSVGKTPDYEMKKKVFLAGYYRQMELAVSNAMEVAVSPFGKGLYESGDGLYIVSEAHMGSSVDKVDFETLDDKLEVIARICGALKILHHNGYVLLDFKPENFLWINESEPHLVKILDLDSVIHIGVREKDDEQIFVAEKDEVLNSNNRYCTYAMRVLRNTLEKSPWLYRDKKKTVVVPQENIFNTGLMMFEYLFEKHPDLWLDICEPDAEQKLRKRYGIDKKMSGDMIRIIQKALKLDKIRLRSKEYEAIPVSQRIQETGYKTIDEMLMDLEKVMTKRKIKTYDPVAVASTNFLHFSYDMLERYPIYDFMAEEGVLDVTLYGSHSMRREMLQALIPCAQMLDTQLKIRLISDDAPDFWEKFTKENPELIRSVHCFENEQPVLRNGQLKYEVDDKIVCRPLADIYLYANENRMVVQEILKKSQYTILLTNDRESERLIKEIISLKEEDTGKPYFTAYIYDGQKVGMTDEQMVLHPIPLKYSAKSDIAAVEKEISAGIYKKGLMVHTYYTRGYKPGIDKTEIEKEYRQDRYSRASSERTAVHTVYKLKSVGIDCGKLSPEEVIVQYKEKVLDTRTGEWNENFDRLVVLEHLSWSAFMICHGVRSIDDEKRWSTAIYEPYAEGKYNDWKIKKDEKYINIACHPCLKSSRPGRRLVRGDWDVRYQKILDGLDPIPDDLDELERWCLKTHRAIREKMENNRERIEDLSVDMEAFLDEINDDSLKDLFGDVTNVKNDCMSGIITAKKFWKPAWNRLESSIKNTECEDHMKLTMLKTLGELYTAMLPVMEIGINHDFKDSDEDLIRVIPRLICPEKDNVVVMKPLVNGMREDIYSTLLIEPGKLILLYDRERYGNSIDSIIAEYDSFLNRKTNTSISAAPFEMLRSELLRVAGRKKGRETEVWIDVTGCEEADIARITQLSLDEKTAGKFKVCRVKDQKLVSDTEVTADKYNSMHMAFSVNEAFRLQGIKVISEKSSCPMEDLEEDQFQALQELHGSLQSERKWEWFCDYLRRIESGKAYVVDCNISGLCLPYKTDLIHNSTIRSSGLEQVLYGLERSDVIENLKLPRYNRRGAVEFQCRYPKLGMVLERIAGKIKDNRGYSHHFVIKELNSDRIVICDDTVCVEDIILSPQKDSEEFLDILKQMYAQYRNELLPFLEFEEMQDHNVDVRFEYACPVVRDVLTEPEAIGKVLAYHKYKNERNFDDIRTDVVIDREGTGEHERIDIVAAKNGELYFL